MSKFFSGSGRRNNNDGVAWMLDVYKHRGPTPRSSYTITSHTINIIVGGRKIRYLKRGCTRREPDTGVSHAGADS